jgi:hypothetical protein
MHACADQIVDLIIIILKHAKTFMHEKHSLMNSIRYNVMNAFQ